MVWELLIIILGVFLKWLVFPNLHPKCWSFLVGKPHGCWANPPFKETPHGNGTNVDFFIHQGQALAWLSWWPAVWPATTRYPGDSKVETFETIKNDTDTKKLESFKIFIYIFFRDFSWFSLCSATQDTFFSSIHENSGWHVYIFAEEQSRDPQ